MSFKLARIAGVCAGLAAVAAPAIAQEPLQQELARLKEEMQRTMSTYQRQISDLEARLKAVEQKAAEAPPPQPAPQASAAPAEAAAPPSPPAFPPPTGSAAPGAAGTGAGSATAFNPQISVVLDGKFNAYDKDPANYRITGFPLGDSAAPGPRGFALGESELGLSSNVDQWLYAAAILSFERDGVVNVEEAYAQTTTLPWGFTVKGGRFFSGIGYLNEQHAHTWDFADAPLVYSALLNQQLANDGLQLRWLAPTDIFLEFGGEVGAGDAFPSGGGANRGVGVWDAFVHVGDDINDASSYRVGTSFLRTLAHDRTTDNDASLFTGFSDTAIVDAVYKWAPGGNPVETNLKLQGEYFWRLERGAFDQAPYIGHLEGFYTQAVYQFMPRWRVGVRYDRAWAADVDNSLLGTAVDNMDHVPVRYSTMIDYSTSEFGRFRFQYNRDEARATGPDNQFILQYTVSFGSHPAHNF